MTVSFFAVNIINSIAMLYASAKIMNSKINYKNYRFYLALFILTLYTFLMYNLTHSFYRMIILVQVYILCNFIIHKRDDRSLTEITAASLINWGLLLMCEIIGGIIIYALFSIIGISKTSNLFANTFISLFIIGIFFILISIKKLIKFLNMIIKRIGNIKTRNLFLVVIYVSALFSMMLYIIYFDLSRSYKMLVLFIIILEYSAILYSIFTEKEKSKNIQNKLDTMIKITTEYEQALEENRISNHENKNQLIVIKDMIDPNNKKAITYLNKLIKNNYQDDNNLLLKISPLPMGGLRGLIYYKMLTMKEKKIDSSISISRRIDKNIFSKIDVELLQSYCKIIGVFLDNAIEAVENNNEKIINIELYTEEHFFVFSVCNKYKGKIEFENLGKKSFSTKGGNHGYGLQLVERLVENNKKMVHEKEIIRDLFIQRIKVNLK